jgi:hypothetical protein
MNWKIVVVGGLLFFIATWIVAPITGPLIHEGVLKETYMATGAFWRPELMASPPNMMALLPYWTVTGLIGAFIMAGIYSIVRPALSGAGWLRGLKFGFGLALLNVAWALGYSGVFNLPPKIWAWWTLEGTAMYLIGGIVLGWISEKLAPVSRSASVTAPV